MNGVASPAELARAGNSPSSSPYGSKADIFLVWLLVLSTFFPYIGIHLGQSTSLSLTSIISLLMVPRLLSSVPTALYALVLIFGPWVATFLSVAAGLAQPSLTALAAWSLMVAAGFGFLHAGRSFPHLLHAPLRVGVLFSSLYALVQKVVFLDAGTIPFIQYYNSPDYADVQVRAEIITQYIKRPFAFFPEPSFMAGSLAIAAVAMIVASRLRRGTATLSVLDWLTLSAVSAAILISASGSALITLGIVWFVAIWPLFRAAGRLVFVTAVSIGLYAVSTTILATRNTSHNWSWDDRSASILGAFRFLFSDTLTMLFGVGKGNSTVLFSKGSIPMSGLDYYTYLPDVYSAAGRMVFENGLLIGGLMVAMLAASIYFGVRRYVGTLEAIGSIVLWFVVAGLTISYESAAWLWAFPALAFGLIQHGKHADDKENC